MNKSAKAAGSLRTGRVVYLAVAALILSAAVFLFLQNKSPKQAAGTLGGDIVIKKSDVTTQAKFISYQVEGTQMEVLAIRAADGTVRTAFNTCQVCYNSGRGYYRQQGAQLVCQNCGNRFTPDDVEQASGGCNPVPILKEDKSDDGTDIVIPADFMKENRGLFGKWKKA